MGGGLIILLCCSCRGIVNGVGCLLLGWEIFDQVCIILWVRNSCSRLRRRCL